MPITAVQKMKRRQRAFEEKQRDGLPSFKPRVKGARHPPVPDALRGVSSRRAMRNMVRARNRSVGLYYDGTPFKGRRQVSPTVNGVDSDPSTNGKPHATAIPAAEESRINSEATRGANPSLTCGHCGAERAPGGKFERCSQCHEKYTVQGKDGPGCWECGVLYVTEESAEQCGRCSAWMFGAAKRRFKMRQARSKEVAHV